MLPWMMTAAPKYVMKLKILLKMLSKEAFEFSKEAEQLIQYAVDMTNFCKQPEKAHAAVLSSILEAAHVAHSSNTDKKTPLEAIPVLSEVLSPAQNIAVASSYLLLAFVVLLLRTNWYKHRSSITFMLSHCFILNPII